MVSNTSNKYDVVVVGAGFAGLYSLVRLNRMGISAVCIEAAPQVGGTWYWNCYPGARCDVMSIDYSFSFDKSIDEEWTWSEKYPPQSEILAYIMFVAKKYDLNKQIMFRREVAGIKWDEARRRWTVNTHSVDADGDALALDAKHVIMATGSISKPKPVDIPGINDFEGEMLSTSRWPRDKPMSDFEGRRVVAIGTGSSGIQVIPEIARANPSRLTVLQRTPAYCLSAFHGEIPAHRLKAMTTDWEGYRASARKNPFGAAVVAVPDPQVVEARQLSALAVTDAHRDEVFSKTWKLGSVPEFTRSFMDLTRDLEANQTICDFVRGRIRDIVKDEKTAELLCQHNYPYGAKRPCVGRDYYETFNRECVELVSLRETPIERVEKDGVRTSSGKIEADVLVCATGFDGITGALNAVEMVGRDGAVLKEEWGNGVKTYLGVMCHGFPNLWLITGPGSPSVLSNMVTAIEQHVEWVTDLVQHMEQDGVGSAEASAEAQEEWTEHVQQAAEKTLFGKAKNSWYYGGNVPGKKLQMLPYVGGIAQYSARCDAVAGAGYTGINLV